MNRLVVFCALSFPVFSGFGQVSFEEALNEAFELIQASDTLGAIAIWERVLEHDPKNYRALNNLSLVYKQLYQNGGAEADKARDAIKRQIQSYPDSAHVYCHLGDLELWCGNYRKSARAYAKSPHSHALADREWSRLLASGKLFAQKRDEKIIDRLTILARNGNARAFEYVTVEDALFVLDLLDLGLERPNSQLFVHSAALHIGNHREAAAWLDEQLTSFGSELSKEIQLATQAMKLYELSLVLYPDTQEREDVLSELMSVMGQVRELNADLDYLEKPDWIVFVEFLINQLE